MSCPVCGSERLRPSRPRGGLEAGLRSLTGTRYHECKECGFRLRRPRGDLDSARPGVDYLHLAAWRGGKPHAWAVVRHVKSNAIVVCKDRMLLGAGAGQMSRVDSVEIAVKKAGDRISGAVLGSDAFFPFPDSIERAAAAGITAIIQPGGSKNDNDVIAACNRAGLAMIFTGRRHFKH